MKDPALLPPRPILIVDDEDYIIKTLRRMLLSSAYNNILSCSDSRQVLPLMQEKEIELVLLDLTMPGLSGFQLLEKIQEEQPQVPVIIITGTDEVGTAISCMKKGAADYFVKPVEENRLLASVKNVLRKRELERENSALKQKLLEESRLENDYFKEIITQNHKMKQIFLYLETIAKTSEAVLITGETGTGKELIARAVHKASGRSGQFICLNIAGLDESMFSDTLFGHRKGAFTTAEGKRDGLLEQAKGGSLFLDEIGDLSPQTQIKLLRLLENREYYPLGADLPKRSSARLIFATNRDLLKRMEEGNMRRDFFYRISTHSVMLPPLRARKEDLPLLIEHFLEQAASEFGREQLMVPQDLYIKLQKYAFPGNIRELRSLVFNAVGAAGSAYLEMALSEEFFQPDSDELEGSSLIFPGALPSLKEASKLLVEEAMRRAKGKQTEAARLLDISPQALSKRLRNQD